MRDKFSAQAIFSYHAKRWLWQHICLKDALTAEDRAEKNDRRAHFSHKSVWNIITRYTSWINIKCIFVSWNYAAEMFKNFYRCVHIRKVRTVMYTAYSADKDTGGKNRKRTVFWTLNVNFTNKFFPAVYIYFFQTSSHLLKGYYIISYAKGKKSVNLPCRWVKLQCLQFFVLRQ